MEYYYSDGQNQFGPVSLEDLRTKIDANTLVWHDGMPSWDKASNVEELKAMFARPTPPPPPVVQQTPMQTPSLDSGKKRDVGLLVMAILGLLASSFSILLSMAIINEPGAWWHNDILGILIFIACIYIIAFSIVTIVKASKKR